MKCDNDTDDKEDNVLTEVPSLIRTSVACLERDFIQSTFALLKLVWKSFKPILVSGFGGC